LPRLVILSPNPANGSGGVERVSSLLARALGEHGWETVIVGPRRAPTLTEFRTGLAYSTVSRSALQEALGHDPDLIVTSGYLGAGQRVRVPRIHIYHGTMVGGTWALADLLPRRELLRRSLSGGIAEALAGHRANHVVCVSEATAAEVRRFYRVRESAIIANGVDESIFAPREQATARRRLGIDPEGRYAAFVGRFEAGKGGATAQAATAAAGYKLLVAGPNGPSEAHLLGTVGPERLADVYAAADCVVLPTRYEACSLVVLESIACGIPVITTRVGWMNTLLDSVPEYHLLCANPDVDSVRARLESLPQLDTLRLTAKARDFVHRHNGFAVWSERWNEMVASLLGAVEPASPPVPYAAGSRGGGH
jgi:glycosyltransferase involved in cell wall biosynthesis